MKIEFLFYFWLIWGMLSVQAVRRMSIKASSDLSFFKNNKLFAVVGASEGSS